MCLCVGERKRKVERGGGRALKSKGSELKRRSMRKEEGRSNNREEREKYRGRD